MDMEVFAGKICTAVEKELGSNYKTEVREIKKNNGILLHGLLILSGKHNVVPTIYLEGYLEAYNEGTSFDEIICRILSVYRKDMVKDRIDMKFFRRFEAVKNRICYRLVGQVRNQAMLREVPHVELLDLAVCFYYAYSDEVIGEGSIPINNFHMEMWNTCTEELAQLAQENTPRLFPWTCRTLEETLAGQCEEEISFLSEDTISCNMRVLSNTKANYGAACILYPGVLETLAESWSDRFYIIPSSIHEVLLLKASENVLPWELEGVVRQINRTQVAPNAVLSDKLYSYSLESKKISMAMKETDKVWEINVQMPLQS